MVFTDPSYLWALLGLLVPLAIHLWSKKEANTIKIGSIQLLDESNSRQSSSIQLNEWLLLLLRMLIVALIVMLMAGPHWRTKGNQKKVTYLVEESLVNDASLRTILDSLQEGSPVRLLKNGFPHWNPDMEYRQDREQPYYWQLVPKMDSLHSDSIVVFTKALVKGFRSMRPNTQKKIHWVVLESEETPVQPLKAIDRDPQVELITLSSNSRATKIEREMLDDGFELTTGGDSLRLLSKSEETVPLASLDTLHINMYVEEEFEREGHYIEASFKALSTYLKQPIIVHREGDLLGENKAQLNVALGTEPKYGDGKWLVYRADPIADRLIQAGQTKDVYWLTSRLDPKNTVEQHLTEQLLYILGVASELDKLVERADGRQLEVTELEPNYVAPRKKRERATMIDVSFWVFGLLGLLMLLERVMAHFKKQ
ncbi:BatA domain-containing protein [Flagellimonas okinawensis]|uniref:BatA domain-containing protein n=1 Tax=Flagellimonas okinawensis TaxID=3031324 RepID=A0ABT5XUC7_9FLAO|nr:BatA domain-containing protein [[Muricauda] okinawensis]MDF0709166.1 BatA domain-containing protein [[Muricauda] okinawensis]